MTRVHNIHDARKQLAEVSQALLHEIGDEGTTAGVKAIPYRGTIRKLLTKLGCDLRSSSISVESLVHTGGALARVVTDDWAFATSAPGCRIMEFVAALNDLDQGE